MQIKFDNVDFYYYKNTPLQQCVLKNICFELEKNNFIAITGRTGSGKSTIINLINAFLKPSSGSIQIDDFINDCKNKYNQQKLYSLRKKIGILFQFASYQLFKDTVIDDVMFGIKNFYADKDAKEKAMEAIKLVGLDSSFYYRSPFELSEGEKKRVAIAGILVYKPELIILDEITVSLDEQSKTNIMNLIKKIQEEQKIKVILVTHDMDIVLEYADTMFLLQDGKIVKAGLPKNILQDADIEKFGVFMPNIFKFINLLRQHGYKIRRDAFSINEIIEDLKNV